LIGTDVNIIKEVQTKKVKKMYRVLTDYLDHAVGEYTAFGSRIALFRKHLYIPLFDVLIRILDEYDGNIVSFMNAIEQGLTGERMAEVSARVI